MALGDVKWIVARGFESHEGTHLPGELAPKSAAEWFNLDAIISMGWLVPYHPENGYADLPPHVYSAVVTLQEARGMIERGEAPVVLDWTEPPEVAAARKEKEDELESLARNDEAAHKAADKLFKVNADEVAVEWHMPESKEDVKKREAEAAAGDGQADKYSDKTKDDLVAEIQKRNKRKKSDDQIAVGGNKPDLVQRLIEDDLTK